MAGRGQSAAGLRHQPQGPFPRLEGSQRIAGSLKEVGMITLTKRRAGRALATTAAAVAKRSCARMSHIRGVNFENPTMIPR